MPELTLHAGSSVTVGPYSDGGSYAGDRDRGERIYVKSCAHCHGTPIMPVEGAALIGSLNQYYQVLARGVPAQNRPYMPEYTLERLSRQQAADLQVYLESLAK
jgi:mono/diheme cytochrome c family protein